MCGRPGCADNYVIYIYNVFKIAVNKIFRNLSLLFAFNNKVLIEAIPAIMNNIINAKVILAVCLFDCGCYVFAPKLLLNKFKMHELYKVLSCLILRIYLYRKLRYNCLYAFLFQYDEMRDDKELPRKHFT